MSCACGQVYVGMHATGSRNWNPDCPAHGLESDYYRSPEQVERRRTQNERVIELQRRAREARQGR